MRSFFLFALASFLLATALTCCSQQTFIPEFSAYAAYSYLGTPSLNLVQRGFDGDFGMNVRPWLTLGADFSYGNGGSSLLPQYLNASTQAKLAPYLPLLPAGYQIAVPLSGTTYTYEAGPQFNYRHFKHLTLFARPALGALHVSMTPHPNDQITTLLVTALLGSPHATQTDTVVFYGFGGGFTWEATPHFGIRVASDMVHYNMFSNLLNGGRNSFRVTIGTKYSFGKNILGK